MEFENLIRLIQTVSESELTGFRYEEDGVRISLKKERKRTVPVSAGYDASALAAQGADGSEKGAAAAGQAADKAGADRPAAGAADDIYGPDAAIVKSPLVGVFYTAPAEDAEPYVSVGDTVKKGQVLATVEAMKLMNEIESEYDGVIEKVLVQNGQGVGYGEPLFVIRQERRQ